MSDYLHTMPTSPLFRLFHSTVLLTMLVAAPGANAQPAPDIPRFSSGKTASPLPAGWQHLKLSSNKNDTEYSLVVDEGTTVLKAVANNAATFLATETNFDPRRFPTLSWRWKVIRGIPTANTRERKSEDAPARLMVSFAGDKSKLSFGDRTAAALAESISGNPFPYAQLMYVWGGKVAVDSITTSTLSARIRMLAVAADSAGIGQWHTYTRNMVDDFRKAFGEEPGNVTAIEVMTDTDNTGGSAETLYGDISVKVPGP